MAYDPTIMPGPYQKQDRKVITTIDANGNTVLSLGGRKIIVNKPLAGQAIRGRKDYLKGEPKQKPTELSGETWAADEIQKLAREFPWGTRPFTKEDISPLYREKKILGIKNPFYFHPDVVRSARDSQNWEKLKDDPTIRDEMTMAGLEETVLVTDADGNIVEKTRPAQIAYGDTLEGKRKQIADKEAAKHVILRSKRDFNTARANAVNELADLGERLEGQSFARYQDNVKWAYQARQAKLDRDERHQDRIDKVKREIEEYKIKQYQNAENIKLALIKEENDQIRHAELVALDREKWEEGRKDRKSDRNIGAIGQGIETLMLLFGGLA